MADENSITLFFSDPCAEDGPPHQPEWKACPVCGLSNPQPWPCQSSQAQKHQSPPIQSVDLTGDTPPHKPQGSGTERYAILDYRTTENERQQASIRIHKDNPVKPHAGSTALGLRLSSKPQSKAINSLSMSYKTSLYAVIVPDDFELDLGNLSTDGMVQPGPGRFSFFIWLLQCRTIEC